MNFRLDQNNKEKVVIIAEEPGFLSHRYEISVKFPSANEYACDLDKFTVDSLARNILSHQEEGSKVLGNLTVSVIHKRSLFKWIQDIKDIILKIFTPPVIQDYPLQSDTQKTKAQELLTILKINEKKGTLYEPLLLNELEVIKKQADNYIFSPLVSHESGEKLLKNLSVMNVFLVNAHHVEYTAKIHSLLIEKGKEEILQEFLKLDELENQTLYFDPFLTAEFIKLRDKREQYLLATDLFPAPLSTLKKEITYLKLKLSLINEKQSLQLNYISPQKADQFRKLGADPKSKDNKETVVKILDDLVFKERERREARVRPYLEGLKLAAECFEESNALLLKISDNDFKVSFKEFTGLFVSWNLLKKESVTLVISSLKEKLSLLSKHRIDSEPSEQLLKKINRLETSASIYEFAPLLKEITLDIDPRTFYLNWASKQIKELRNPVIDQNNVNLKNIFFYELNSDFILLKSEKVEDLEQIFSRIEKSVFTLKSNL